MIDGVIVRYMKWVYDDRFIPLRQVDNVFGWMCQSPKFKNPHLNVFKFPFSFGYGITATIYTKIMESQNTVNKKSVLDSLKN